MRRGRKSKIEVTPDMVKEVEILAGRGFTNVQIHTYFGYSQAGWEKKKKRHPEIAEAMVDGKLKTIAMVAGKLMEAIKKGNMSAIIFYLKTQAKWRETSDAPIAPVSDDEKTRYTITTTDPIEAARIYQKIMIGS